MVRLHTRRAFERDRVCCLVVTPFAYHWHSSPSHCQGHIVRLLVTAPGLANAVFASTPVTVTPVFPFEGLGVPTIFFLVVEGCGI